MAQRLRESRLAGSVHRVRTGGRAYRVLRPTAPSNAYLVEERWSMLALVDRAATTTLLGSLELAARSPRSIVFVDIRHTPPPDDIGDFSAPVGRSESLDIVLAHHSLQLPPSNWGAVRSRLGRGTPQTFRLPAPRMADSGTVDRDRTMFREFRDSLRFTRAGRSFFVTGSAVAFREAAASLRGQVAAGLPAGAEGRYRRLCTEIDAGGRPFRKPGRGSRSVPGTMHLEMEL